MKDDILCKLYVDIYSDVSDECETEILDRDSAVTTTPPHKQLQLVPQFITVKVKQVQSEEGSHEPHSPDDKTSQETKDTGRVFKIQHVYEYFMQKFRSVYSRKQELSCDGHDTMAGSPEIQDVQSKKNIKIWGAGENGV